jgi:hypothetical protein
MGVVRAAGEPLIAQVAWDVRSRSAFAEGASVEATLWDGLISATHPSESVREACSKQGAR